MSLPRLDCVVASTRTGDLLQELSDDGPSAMLRDLAATLPELLGSPEPGVCNRALGPFDVATTFDSEIFRARASWRAGRVSGVSPVGSNQGREPA